MATRITEGAPAGWVAKKQTSRRRCQKMDKARLQAQQGQRVMPLVCNKKCMQALSNRCSFLPWHPQRRVFNAGRHVLQPRPTGGFHQFNEDPVLLRIAATWVATKQPESCCRKKDTKKPPRCDARNFVFLLPTIFCAAHAKTPRSNSLVSNKKTKK